MRQTDGRTDGRQPVTLCLPLNAAGMGATHEGTGGHDPTEGHDPHFLGSGHNMKCPPPLSPRCSETA